MEYILLNIDPQLDAILDQGIDVSVGFVLRHGNWVHPLVKQTSNGEIIRLFNSSTDLDFVTRDNDWTLGNLLPLLPPPTQYLLNSSGNCYGILLENVFFPVRDLKFDGMSIRAKPPMPSLLPYAALHKFIQRFNKNKQYQIIPKTALIFEKKQIGFIGTNDLWYYHSPVTIDISLPLMHLMYPYTLELQPADDILPIHARKLAKEANYRNYQYKLILMEFTAMLQESTNKPLRDNIISLIKTSNLADSADRAKIMRLIPLRDLPRFKQIIGDDLLDRFNDTRFLFDLTILYDLRKNPEKIHKKLKKLLSNAIVFSTSPDIELPNIMTACSRLPTQMQCRDGKLIMSRDRYNEMIDILAGDIQNPFKNNMLLQPALTRQNMLKFNRRKNEIITM